MDSKMVLGLLARHALTTLAGILAANGYIGGSNKEQFIGAGMLFLGVAWSWYQKSGKVLVDKDIARFRGVAVLAMFTVLALAMVPSAAKASDLAAKQSALAYSPAPCLPASCSGFFAGVNLSGTMTNANVIGNGINGSLAGGGQSIGVQIGYQFANGTWFFGPEFDANYVVAGSAVPGASPSKYRVGEYMKVGTSLATLLGLSVPTGATPSVPEKFAAQVISPYLIFGAVQSGIGQGWATGAGVEFALAANWFVDSRYTYINYGNAAVTPTITVPSENLVTIGFNYKF